MEVKRIKASRIPMELKLLKDNYENHGIICDLIDEVTYELKAVIKGPKNTPYETGYFTIQIKCNDYYPFRPPMFNFVTPIFHPNIDNSGNICLDLLHMPPNGTYNPAISLECILLSIQLLLATPNADDPLNAEAADLYKHDKRLFEEKARNHTGTYAVKKNLCSN